MVAVQDKEAKTHETLQPFSFFFLVALKKLSMRGEMKSHQDLKSKSSRLNLTLLRQHRFFSLLAGFCKGSITQQHCMWFLLSAGRWCLKKNVTGMLKMQWMGSSSKSLSKYCIAFPVHYGLVVTGGESEGFRNLACKVGVHYLQSKMNAVVLKNSFCNCGDMLLSIGKV